MVNGNISQGNNLFKFHNGRNFFISSESTGTVFCRDFTHIILSSVIQFLLGWYNQTRIAQSVQQLAKGWTVLGSNPGGREFLHTRPDLPWSVSSLLYNEHRAIPGGKPEGMVLTTHPNQRRGQRKNRSIPPLPLWAFVGCYRVKPLPLTVGPYYFSRHFLLTPEECIIFTITYIGMCWNLYHHIQ